MSWARSYRTKKTPGAAKSNMYRYSAEYEARRTELAWAIRRYRNTLANRMADMEGVDDDSFSADTPLARRWRRWREVELDLRRFTPRQPGPSEEYAELMWR